MPHPEPTDPLRVLRDAARVLRELAFSEPAMADHLRRMADECDQEAERLVNKQKSD